MGKRRSIALVSVYLDLGAGRRGVDMGPSALRIAGLTSALEALGHEVEEVGTVYAGDPERTSPGESRGEGGRALYLEEILDVCRRTHELVLGSLARDCLPLILGGDHSLSIGTVSAAAAHHRSRGDSIGLIWVDAHTDLNTPETTPSGNVHGMPLAILLGEGAGLIAGTASPGWMLDKHETGFEGGEGAPGGPGLVALRPEHVSILGVRETDPLERGRISELGVRIFTMSEIDERGVAACMDEAIARASSGTAGYHLSFDLDVIDPMIAPGVGSAVDGGLTFREAHLLCEKVARSEKLLSLEMVELNPVLDERNRTARLGVELIASALGKTIL